VIKDFFEKNKAIILALFLAGLISDVFFNPQINDTLIFFLIAYWLFLLFVYRLKSRQSLNLTLIALMIAFVFQFSGKEMLMEKSTSWGLIFLLIYLGQKLWQKFFSQNEKT